MLLFSVTYAFYKAANPYLSNVLSMFFVNAFSWFFILPYILNQGYRHLATHRFPMIALRTIFGLLSLYFITLALKNTPLAEVMLLNNSAPLFVPIIAWIWHRAKTPFSLWLGLFVGFAGIILILKPGFGEMNIGLIYALLSGLFAALVFVSTAQIAHEPFSRTLFYYFSLFWIILSPFLFTQWTFPPLLIWLYLAIAGVSMLGAQLTITAGLRMASSHGAAAFIYTGVIFSGLIDWIFWKEVPHMISLLGMIVVCMGGLITILRKS